MQILQKMLKQNVEKVIGLLKDELGGEIMNLLHSDQKHIAV